MIRPYLKTDQNGFGSSPASNYWLLATGYWLFTNHYPRTTVFPPHNGPMIRPYSKTDQTGFGSSRASNYSLPATDYWLFTGHYPRTTVLPIHDQTRTAHGRQPTILRSLFPCSLAPCFSAPSFPCSLAPSLPCSLAPRFSVPSFPCSLGPCLSAPDPSVAVFLTTDDCSLTTVLTPTPRSLLDPPPHLSDPTPPCQCVKL